MVKEELEGEDTSSGAMGVAEMTGNAGVTVGQSQTPAGYRWWHGELIPLTPEEQKAVQETLSGVHEKRWKSGWQNRAVMLMALYNKERWLELDRAMKLFPSITPHTCKLYAWKVLSRSGVMLGQRKVATHGE